MHPYHRMSRDEAAAALLEFLEERPRALRALEARLRSTGVDPGPLLDTTPGSLTPLWQWGREELTPREPDERPRTEAWPSWLRHTVATEPLLSEHSIRLVDGMTSYLCRVVESGAPAAGWRSGHDRVRNYGWQNHPVLARGRDEFALGDYAAVAARRHLRGTRPELQPVGLPQVPPPADDHFSILAVTLIGRLGGPASTIA